jgi:hypothetical protein
MATKIYTIAYMPDELAKAWLQHLREFDTAHPGCHFEIVGDTDASLDDLRKLVADITPEFDFQAVFKR